MVLESLISPYFAEKKPLMLVVVGILYASIAMFLGLWIFRDEASLIIVFLTVIACVPFMFKMLKYEENKSLKYTDEVLLIKEHSKALNYLMCLFIGFVIAFTIWYLFMPEQFTYSVFSAQTNTINAINNQIMGHSIKTNFLSKIILNNIKVLFFCILFSFVYGAGAIFILTWNASVISVAIGNFIRNGLADVASYVGFTKLGSYLHVVSFGVLRYMTHGIFEILAYFVGGLAGGLVSVALIRRKVDSKDFNMIMFDVCILTLIAVFILFFAGIIEVYLTPLLFN